MKSQILIVGAGGWGTALGLVLHRNGHPVRFWGRREAQLEAIRANRENAVYLPGIQLPEAFEYTSEVTRSLDGVAGVVFSPPSRFFRSVVETFQGALPSSIPTLSVSKGLDPTTHARMTDVVGEVLGSRAAVLSGPSHAEEVAKGETPAAVTVAAHEEAEASFWQDCFNAPIFRVYRSQDVAGVELGGVLKNVMAIAAGIADGIGFGDNAKAALITRGLAEMTRLGQALGAEADTFAGLSGLGDLMVTCTSRHSRNRGVGERIGSGETIDEILASMEQVAEGYWNAATARKVAAEKQIEAPITEEVYAVLYEGKNPKQAVIDLLNREVGRE